MDAALRAQIAGGGGAMKLKKVQTRDSSGVRGAGAILGEEGAAASDATPAINNSQPDLKDIRSQLAGMFGGPPPPPKAAEFRSRAAAFGGGGGGGGGVGAQVPSSGLFVMHVAPDSPAARGGVRVGDTIVGLDGARLRTTKDLIDGLAEQVGRKVELELKRGEGGGTERAAVHVESMQQQ